MTQEASPPAPAQPRQEIAVTCTGLSKRFGATQALADVDLTLKGGEIHALVGQNGAGKSTLLGVLAGRVAPDAGHIEVFRTSMVLGRPREARQQGIVAIYQELTTVPALSAVENVFLGQPLARSGVLSAAEMRREFMVLCERLGHRIAPGAMAGELSVADQQLLEIMRSVRADARVMLFDEPTAALAPAEREALFALMRDLREEGIAIALVSHNLDEVLAIADEVTVFRNGRRQATAAASRWTKRTLVDAMLGERGGEALGEALLDGGRHERQISGAPPRRDVVVEVSGLALDRRLREVDLVVRHGEILGVAGLVGSGRTTLLRAMAGLEPKARGTLRVGGTDHRWPTTVRAALRHGIAMVPEDRKDQGLVLGLTAAENIAIGDLSAVARGGWLSPRRMRSRSAALAGEFGLDRARLDGPVRELSGGNQQKALLARWGMRPPAVLLADEPTRGIDIGAKQDVFRALRRFAQAGTAVVLVSSELEEIVAMADRVVVMAAGRIVAERTAGDDEISVGVLLDAAFELEDPR
jgi:ABC-type sugar transport system ATPase subunit